MKIGVDIDEPLYPWLETSHQISQEAGITNGRPLTTWYPWDSYGCTVEEWTAVIDAATVTGELYDALPTFAGHAAVVELHDAGHEIHLVTARGCGWQHSRLVRYLTERWLREWQIPHHSLTFAKNKAPVAQRLGLEAFVDDRPKNYDELTAAGVDTYLLDSAHNQDPDCTRRRVLSMYEFADRIRRDERSAAVVAA
ncbi:hypothetical protein OG474_30660 [Kribbella sp. NBC_01505]|uniref:hypothetical protein n=1 Tax=Kribbella sp. NBC_01505 TaxID=2903580 RepID=UPI00386D171F